ncbi:hypothetical protein [Nioella sp. MMSF_3534]|uniref:hypothetical protein n=1 Tax=Nioella sp. MMSF_3534 TaxID=3046720 RepID=UPI00273D303E|nr:hypothetical protein [Nioella sp. MMSF_3534]
MNISPRIIAIATIGLGALTFGALMTEARSSNIRPLNVETMRELIQGQASAEPEVTVLTSASTGSNGANTPIETPAPALALPVEAPEAPVLPQPQRLAQASEATTTMTDQALSPFGLPCGLTVSTSASEGAVVALDIMDPCQPHSRVIIEHSGLNLTGRTDVMGLLTMDVPVFENPAFFTVRMPDGASDSSLAIVPDLDSYYRVGLQWNEDRALELHAMEFGATYGDPGHIWLDHAGSVDRAVAGEGGFVMQVGSADVENPMLAQIYSFPRDTLDGNGNVRLSIEAPVTEANCGQDTLARTLELEEDGRVAVIELTFTLPDCDAVGDYLVLQNLLHDLRVASN